MELDSEAFFVIEIMLSSDPLEDPNFDAIQHINALFPNESSLNKIDDYFHELSTQIQDIDEEIREAVQAQSHIGEQATNNLMDAKQSIFELIEKVGEIQGKAKHSENMVQMICDDIKRLDIAKNHLQTSITALEQLQILITAVSQLEILSSDRNYREASRLLSAIDQLFDNFKNYRERDPRLGELREKVDTIKGQFKFEADLLFERIGEVMSSASSPSPSSSGESNPFASKIQDMCLVVDALGQREALNYITIFLDSQLKDYATIFSNDREEGKLDLMDRRFAWIKRVVKALEERAASLFPPHWEVPRRLVVEFLSQTRSLLEERLTDQRWGEERRDCTLLLKALHATLKFEKDMSGRYDPMNEEGGSSTTSGSEFLDDEGNVVDPLSAKGIRMKYEAQRKRKIANEVDAKRTERLRLRRKSRPFQTSSFSTSSSLSSEEERKVGKEMEEEEETYEEVELLELPEPLPIKGLLSKIFDMFLETYVDMERVTLSEMLNKATQTEVHTF